MEKKTTEEMLNYVIKMRERGDDYRAVLNYLNRHTDDKRIIEKIISTVTKLEEEGEIKQTDQSIPLYLETSFWIGFFLIASGVFLVIFLWNEGFIASLPLALIAFGITGMMGKMK